MAKYRPSLYRHVLWMDIDRLLAASRARFGAATMTQPDPAPPAPPAPEPPAPTSPAPPAAPPAEDSGFPPNTPLERMTGEQREAYWRFHARKHEERVKALGGLTPEKLAELQDKATRHDALELELMSDKDKAVAEATATARAEALAANAPKLVRAEFKAALTSRVAADELETRLGTIVDTLDLSKFIDSNGDVDTAKVTAFVDTIAPVTGNGTGTGMGRRGPTATRHGSGSGSGSGSTALTGRELFEQRHKKSSTSA